jgi:hypothetical protein
MRSLGHLYATGRFCIHHYGNPFANFGHASCHVRDHPRHLGDQAVADGLWILGGLTSSPMSGHRSSLSGAPTQRRGKSELESYNSVFASSAIASAINTQ